VTAMLLILSPAFPVFAIVRLWMALEVFTIWLPKVSMEGDKLAMGPLATPAPASPTVCMPPLELSETVSKALLAPAVEGLNVKLIVQLPPTARVAGDIGQLLVWVKSLLFAPVTAMLLILSPAFPVFAIVRVWAALDVLTSWLPKVSVLADRLATGPALIPVPARTTVWGLPLAELSEMVTTALSAPAVEGLNVSPSVQTPPTERVAGATGQLLVWLKSPTLVPVIPILLMVKAVVPVFVSDTFWVELVVPTGSPANDRFVWDNVALGPGAGSPFSDDGKSNDQTSPVLLAPGRNRTNRSAETS
jgi:hypothetical protein